MQNSRIFALGIFLAVNFAAIEALACSGPGAAEMIERNTSLGYVLFGASALLGALAAGGMWRLGCTFKRLRWVFLPVGLHPGWWWSASMGDCGTTRVIGSWIGLGLTAVVAAVMLGLAFRQYLRKKKDAAMRQG